ncbi:hypothetical protein NDU88_006302, partial [Pleurodeles waltl]
LSQISLNIFSLSLSSFLLVLLVQFLFILSLILHAPHNPNRQTRTIIRPINIFAST